MQSQNSLRLKLTTSILVVLCALTISSCANSNVFSEVRPKIPNLPSNVTYKKTILPKIPEGATLEEREKINKKLLTEFKKNDSWNRRAIETAQKNHKKLQAIQEGKGP